MQEGKCRWLRLRLVLALLAVLQGRATGVEGSSGIIAEGTIWETGYYIIEAKEAGPIVMVVGGVHGDEEAGARAAEHIRQWRITRGRLIVLPRANEPGLKANTRLMPGLPRDRGNLNRNFPWGEGESAKCTLSSAIWELVRSQRPDWLVDLHEGSDFTQVNGKSVGSSVIAAKLPEVTEQARRMLDAVNETIEDPNRKFVLKGPAVNGSLARSAAERLKIKSMILETTYKDPAISRRTRQHRIMVHRLLTDLGMLEHGPDVLVGDVKGDETIYAALYDGDGVGGKGPGNIERYLRPIEGIVIRRIGVPEIAGGVLKQFDVMIVPGGSGSRQARALGTDGCRAIVEFVENGGGYAGFCAGAYLASNNYTWSLKIIDAKVIDREHWKRGTGQVKIELTSEGRRLLLNKRGLIDIRYANGPILAPAEDPGIADFQPLAHFRTEIAKNGAPTGVMKDTPAIIVGRFGKGRVFCSSPHPESTDGLEPFVRGAIRWAAGR